MKMRFIQYKKVIGLAVAALTFTACTETWDDHYVDTPLAGANEGTLWQALEQNPELSNFRKVVEACHYDNALKSSQMFSVFAPSNDYFTQAQADSVIALYNSEVQANVRTTENRAIRQFLQNHIARYTHSVADTIASAVSDSVVMMNGKYVVLNSQTFGGQQLLSKNRLYENGVLFTLKSPVKFYNNIFEYVNTDSTLSRVAEFLYDDRYYRYELDEELSVPGDIVDGKTTYLDSVMVKDNELFYELGRINNEDSTYWMVLPTNEQWDKMVTEFEPYFMYNEKVAQYDSLRWAMPRLDILVGTVFSLNANTALARYADGENVQVDSVRSTNGVPYSMRKRFWGSDTLAYYEYKTPFAEGGVFDGVEYVQCSNGRVLKADQWNVDKRQTFFRDIVVEAENASISVNSTNTKRATTIRVPSWSKYYGKISNNQFVQISPSNSNIHHTDVAFYIPNVLSNVPYDIYLVTVPANAADSTITDLKPTSFDVSRLYKELDGTGSMHEEIVGKNSARDGNENDAVYNDAAHKLGSFNGTMGRGYGSGLDVDTICIGKGVTFPSCSFGLSNPEVQIRLHDTSLIFLNMNTNTLRIDCIIFRPHLEATDEQ